MMRLVRGIVANPKAELQQVALPVDRITLAKRLWRGTAADGTEFGFELDGPLKHGDTVFETESKRYVISQSEEAVIEISLDVTPAAAAGIGWAVGNLHLELSGEPSRLLAPDEPAMRQLLERLMVPYRTTTAIFRPCRFSRNAQPAHELGPSHRH